MKDRILEIADSLKSDEITVAEAKNELLDLFGVADGWTCVSDKWPPNSAHGELLAKSPDGSVYICGWRQSYLVFTVQGKHDSSRGWQWKLI